MNIQNIGKLNKLIKSGHYKKYDPFRKNLQIDNSKNCLKYWVDVYCILL